MNLIGIALAWCIVQVTLVAVATAIVCRYVRRGGPQARAQAVFVGLLLTIALTILAFSSWPRWDFSKWRTVKFNAVADSKVSESKVSSFQNDSRKIGDTGLSTERNSEESRTASGESDPAEYFVRATTLLKSVIAEMQKQPAVESTTWDWRGYAVLIFVFGLLIGLVRLVLGLSVVRSYRLRARPVRDSRIQEMADVLLAELSGPKVVNVCESTQLTTPATVGWRRPLIILPIDCCDWTEQECRVVLSHEIAHIARQDYATWIVAQLALVVHFYHPLIHWLAARLRLEQELAADAAAARMVGGQRSYLMTLAGMALRCNDQRLAWPARTFLPTRGTLMRRIEMLRDEKLNAPEMTKRFKWGIVAALALAGLGVAGLRGAADESKPSIRRSGGAGSGESKREPADRLIPEGETQAPGRSTRRTLPGAASLAIAPTTGNAESSSQAAGSTDKTELRAIGETEPQSLAWVPRDAFAVARFRPQLLLGRPRLAPLAKLLLSNPAFQKQLGVPVDRFVEVTMAFVTPPPGEHAGTFDPVAVIHKMATAADATNLLKALQPESEEQEFAGQKYVRGKNGHGPVCFFADERTVVASGREEFLRRVIVAGKIGASKAKWADIWMHAPSADLVLFVNAVSVKGVLAPLNQSERSSGPDSLLFILLQHCDSALLTADVLSGANFTLELSAVSDPSAQKVRDALSALAAMTQSGLSKARADFSQRSDGQVEMMLRAVDLLDTVLDTVEIAKEGIKVRAKGTMDADQVTSAISALVPALETARQSAPRLSSINNLKQIGLAMHNYYEGHGAFPPAVLYGPDGKTSYSWRVALLPYLDQVALYEQYRKDEPWDGPNNKLLLSKMPAVFRDPTDAADSTFSSYFVVTGPTTVFSGKEGVKMAELTDGTSNTLLVAEARQSTPWTKPEDIPYENDKQLPKLGGHHPNLFLAAMADGAVRAFPMKLKDEIFKAIITRGGGEVIDWSSPALRVDVLPPVNP